MPWYKVAGLINRTASASNVLCRPISQLSRQLLPFPPECVVARFARTCGAVGLPTSAPPLWLAPVHSECVPANAGERNVFYARKCYSFSPPETLQPDLHTRAIGIMDALIKADSGRTRTLGGRAQIDLIVVPAHPLVAEPGNRV